jgi:TatA/E family protein of Tat protein translocase
MPQLGPLEIAVVLLIALLVFGPNRLPELAKQVGGALRELKKIQQNIKADLHDMMRDESDGAAPPPTLPPKADGADGIEGADAPSGNGSGGVSRTIDAGSTDPTAPAASGSDAAPTPPASSPPSPSEAEAD